MSACQLKLEGSSVSVVSTVGTYSRVWTIEETQFDSRWRQIFISSFTLSRPDVATHPPTWTDLSPRERSWAVAFIQRRDCERQQVYCHTPYTCSSRDAEISTGMNASTNKFTCKYNPWCQTPTCFGTRVLPWGSILEWRNTSQNTAI